MQQNRTKKTQALVRWCYVQLICHTHILETLPLYRQKERWLREPCWMISTHACTVSLCDVNNGCEKIANDWINDDTSSLILCFIPFLPGRFLPNNSPFLWWRLRTVRKSRYYAMVRVTLQVMLAANYIIIRIRDKITLYQLYIVCKSCGY